MQKQSDSSSQFKENTVHLVGLTILAIAQPLLGLFSGQPEFFVVRRSEPVDIVLLAVVLSVVIPALLIGIELLARAFSKRLYKVVHFLLIAVLGATFSLQTLNRALPFSGVVLISFSVLIGLVLSYFLMRVSWIRTFLKYVSFLSVIFVLSFFVNPRIWNLIFPASIGSGSFGRTGATTSIVFVVLDAFPVSVLMDADEQIDESRFPNFARLSREATWFRNATTVSDNTLNSVPSILSGKHPRHGTSPTISEHPNNLFTLLAESHDLHIQEMATRLSPTEDEYEPIPPLKDRLASLRRDVTVVYLHTTLPKDLTSFLPSISQGWGNFRLRSPAKGSGDSRRSDPAERFNRFLDSIRPTKKPTLHFTHLMLPHPPYLRYASGTTYTRATVQPSGEGDQWGDWSNDPLVTVQAYQRLMLQAGFVDGLVGRLMDRLREVGLLDRCVLVITSDHGASHRPGQSHRGLTESNYGEIMPVPLFVRVPNQEAGQVSDDNVESIDILPSIAELLGIELGWEVDGKSVFSGVRGETGEKTCFRGGRNPLVVEIHELETARRSARQEIRQNFHDGVGDPVFSAGPHPEMIGREPKEFEILAAGEDTQLVVNELDGMKAVSLSSGAVPGCITGFLKTPQRNWELALSLNGRIQATTRGYLKENLANVGAWSALVPESAFVEGPNNLEVFLIENGDPTHARLRKIPLSSETQDFLNFNIGVERISGFERRGFQKTKRMKDGRSMAWTSGRAFINVPISQSHPPRFLDVEILKSSSKGCKLSIYVNQRAVFSDDIPPGEFRSTFDLEGLPIRERMSIRIESTTFRHKNAKKQRKFGVAVLGVWLRE